MNKGDVIRTMRNLTRILDVTNGKTVSRRKYRNSNIVPTPSQTNLLIQQYFAQGNAMLGVSGYPSAPFAVFVYIAGDRATLFWVCV